MNLNPIQMVTRPSSSNSSTDETLVGENYSGASDRLGSHVTTMDCVHSRLLAGFSPVSFATGVDDVLLHLGAISDRNYVSWYSNFKADLYRMKALEHGWDSYDAPTPNDSSIIASDRFLDLLSQCDRPPVHMGPSVSGGIGFTITSGGREAVVEFTNDDGTNLALINHDDESSLRTLSFTGFLNLRESLMEEMGRFLDAEYSG